MSVESEILRIQHNIAGAYAKVSEKGGDVPLQPNSANLAAAVESIPAGAGGGTVQWEDINGRPDLSNVSTMKVVTVTLLAVGWVDGEQSIAIPDISADEKEQLITPVPSSASYDVYYSSNIICSAQSEGSLTFKADSAPEEDVVIYIFIQSVVEIGEEYAGTFQWWSPKMTEDNAPSPYVASISSVINTKAYQAFDGDLTTFAHTANVKDSWIQLDCGIDIVIKGISFTPFTDYQNDWYKSIPKSFTLYGSKNATDWDVVYNSDGSEYVSVTPGERHEYAFPAVKYRYYKIVSHSNFGNKYYFIVDEIEFLKLETAQ